MPEVRNHQDLEVWLKTIELAKAVYRLSERFPSAERFGLTAQIRKAAVSVLANIAEGAGRNGTKEFVAFLGIASGSVAEIDAHLILSQCLQMVPANQVQPVRDQVAEVRGMLAGLKRSLRNRT